MVIARIKSMFVDARIVYKHTMGRSIHGNEALENKAFQIL